MCVGGIRRAKSSGTSQYIKCTVCRVLMRLYMDKTSREEQPQAFLAVPLCLRACVRECASCGQVRKQPGSRIMFVLTEGESTEPPLLPPCKQRQDADGESEASWHSKQTWFTTDLFEVLSTSLSESVWSAASRQWVHWRKLKAPFQTLESFSKHWTLILDHSPQLSAYFPGTVESCDVPVQLVPIHVQYITE